MSLNDITKKILSDAEIEAKAISEESKKDEDKIIASKNQEIVDAVEIIKTKSQMKSGKLREQAEFKKRMIKKNAILRAKQEIIEEAFLLAKEKLMKLDEADYIRLLATMLGNSPVLDNANIKVTENKKDMVKRALKEAGLDYSISKENLPKGQGGFVLSSESVEINNTIDSLVKSRRNDFEEKVVGMLFG